MHANNMARNAYDILGINEDATEAAIERAYQLRLMDAQSDTSISDSAREAAMAEINRAYQTLSRTTSRARYDKSLGIASAGHQAVFYRRPQFIALIILIATLAGSGFWFMQYQEAKQREIDARLAEEAEAAAATAKAARERLNFELQQAREAAERQVAEEQRIEQLRLEREREMPKEKYVVLPPVKGASTLSNRDMIDSLAGRWSELSESRRVQLQAQMEADQQRRYLQQLQEEERRAAEARARAK